MPIDRRAMSEQLLQRTMESNSRIDDSGKYSNIFRKDMRLPLWKLSDGLHTIDILPFQIGENYPTRPHPLAAGTWTYLLDLWVHRGVGVTEDSFVCPSRNYGLPCPICEYVADLRRDVDPDADENDPVYGPTIKKIKALGAKRRTVYNIVCWDSDQEANKGVQIWEVSYHFMERYLASLAERPRGGGFVNFADPVDGMSIIFRKDGKIDYTGHRFDPRPEPVPQDLFDAVYCLDDLIVVPTYEELYEAFYGQPYDEATAPEPGGIARPTTSGRGGRTVVNEEETVPDMDLPPEPAPVRRGRGTAPAAASPQQTRSSRPAPEQAPAGTPRRAPATAPAQQAPAPTPTPRRAPAASQTCPVGGEFGIAIDTYEECNNCECWDECARSNAEMMSQPEPEPAPAPTPTPTRRGTTPAAAPAPTARRAPAPAAPPAPAGRTRAPAPPPAPTRRGR